MTVTYTNVPPPIPMDCICAYTWGLVDGRVVPVRNAALSSCPAGHTDETG